MSSLTSAVPGERRSGWSNANAYISHNNTAVQNITLREGDGIALTAVSDAVACTMKFLITVIFKIGTAGYVVSNNITTEPRPNFAIFNNSG